MRWRGGRGGSKGIEVDVGSLRWRSSAVCEAGPRRTVAHDIIFWRALAPSLFPSAVAGRPPNVKRPDAAQRALVRCWAASPGAVAAWWPEVLVIDFSMQHAVSYGGKITYSLLDAYHVYVYRAEAVHYRNCDQRRCGAARASITCTHCPPPRTCCVMFVDSPPVASCCLLLPSRLLILPRTKTVFFEVQRVMTNPRAAAEPPTNASSARPVRACRRRPLARSRPSATRWMWLSSRGQLFGLNTATRSPTTDGRRENEQTNHIITVLGPAIDRGHLHLHLHLLHLSSLPFITPHNLYCVCFSSLPLPFLRSLPLLLRHYINNISDPRPREN